jgi:putative acyl-CoA dehydrogenase
MALTLQASLLLRYSPSPVAEAFTRSRLGGEWGQVFGTLPRGVDTGLILDRARPRR